MPSLEPRCSEGFSSKPDHVQRCESCLLEQEVQPVTFQFAPVPRVFMTYPAATRAKTNKNTSCKAVSTTSAPTFSWVAKKLSQCQPFIKNPGALPQKLHVGKHLKVFSSMPQMVTGTTLDGVGMRLVRYHQIPIFGPSIGGKLNHSHQLAL